jgi:hypothetical protein
MNLCASTCERLRSTMVQTMKRAEKGKELCIDVTNLG